MHTWLGSGRRAATVNPSPCDSPTTPWAILLVLASRKPERGVRIAPAINRHELIEFNRGQVGSKESPLQGKASDVAMGSVPSVSHHDPCSFSRRVTGAFLLGRFPLGRSHANQARGLPSVATDATESASCKCRQQSSR